MCEKIDAGASIETAAREAGCSWNTAAKWLKRWHDGDRELLDRSSRPRRMPRMMTPFAELEIVRCRAILKLGAHRLARAAGRPGSTIAKVLKRRGMSKLAPLPPRAQYLRYEHAMPGDMLHVDIKRLVKFEQIGHRIHGDRRRGTRRIGLEHVHVAVDDHSRYSYVEILGDQTTDTCNGFIERAQAFYAERGVRIDRVLTDNGSGYKQRWREHLTQLGMRPKNTRPYRPQTNGKAERFIQTLLREWAYGRPYATSRERHAALGSWLHSYNHHRPHGSLANAFPSERMPHNNVCRRLT
jgi:transposase InsO family protein